MGYFFCVKIFNIPDTCSNQLFGQRWVMVGVVGNTSLLACWHWLNIGPTLKFQQFKYCCWLNVGTSTTHQRWNLSCGGQFWPTNMLADNSRVIFLNIKFILIMQTLHNLLLGENSVILFAIIILWYLVILSDFDHLKLDKILEIFIKSLWVFCKNLITH